MLNSMATSVMKPDFPGVFAPASNHSVKVAIGYDDFPDGQRAMRMCQHLIEQLGREFQFSARLWKFALLAVPKLAEDAAQDAAEADMIIISAHGRGTLPNDLKDWVSGTPVRRRRGARALIALLDAADEPGTEASPAYSYLQQVAKEGNIDFFSRTFPTPATCSHLLAGRLSSSLEELLQERVATREWGINE